MSTRAEIIAERIRTATPEQYNWLPVASDALRDQAEDRRAVAIGHWMQHDASTAAVYLLDEFSNAVVSQLGVLVKCGDDVELLRRFKAILLGPGMCDALEACKCDDYQPCPIHPEAA